MATTSQKLVFDSRLVVVEELLLQRKYEAARKDLLSLPSSEFADESIQAGLYLSLTADIGFIDGDYQEALDKGLHAARILAGSPHNRQYARTLHILSKTYWALGNLKAAEDKAHDAVASYRRAGDDFGQGSALNELAHIAFMRSDFPSACEYLDQAIALAEGHPAKAAMLSANAGRVRTLMGEWLGAESDLKAALEYFRLHGDEAAEAESLLSLGYVHLRKREFVFAEGCFSDSREIIDRLGLKRQRIFQQKYSGELAYEKGDLYRAKTFLEEAYQAGMKLAPESALISQAGRRLAEVELSLDNVDQATKYAHKALGLAMRIGEQAEIGQARRVIAEAFAARSEFSEALENSLQAVEAAEAAGDPLDLARTILSLAEIMILAESEDTERIGALYTRAGKLFGRLGLDHWTAETDYRAGVLACRIGQLSRGFRKLSRSERVFSELAETAKVRRVSQFLTGLADQAVALSVSDDNEFRLFGRLINQTDIEDIDASQMGGIIEALCRRTGADRVAIVTPDLKDGSLTSSVELTDRQVRTFVDGFRRLLDEEISTTKPTLMLDCRRDPYVAELFSDMPEVIASVLVVPYRMGDGTRSYIYLDRFSSDGSLNPFNQDALNFSVGYSDIVAFKSAELQRARLVEDNRRLKAQLMEEAAFPNIITRNHEMLRILDQVRQVVDSPISVAIHGPTGSGKDLLARAIHYNSIRRECRFISVNCAALPETLLESELFGYRRGAFTGADRDKPGLFEEADGGTFFLDEIADMPLSVQAKILRVLEEKELVRLGESMPRAVDVRIISATNKALKDEMEAGRFRQDLFYRLAGLTFQLPSLADRREDVPLLVEHFLAESGKSISPAVMKHLMAYDWPGNVRELDNEVKKLVLLSSSETTIETDLLSSKIMTVGSTGQDSLTGQSVSTENIAFDQEYSLYDYLASHERRFIVQALKERNGVKKHAAALLSIPESTLRLKIKEYNIDLARLDSVN